MHAGSDAEGTTGYAAGRPHPALGAFVSRYAGYRESAERPVRRRQAPQGGCTLIIGLGPPLRLHGPAGPLVGRSFLAGMHDSAVVTEFTGTQEGIQVDLSPLGTHVLLGRPLSDLTGRCPALDELGIPALAALPEQVAQLRSWAARFSRVDTVLRGLLAASRTRPSPEVAWAWRQLVRTGGRVPVAELARGCGWSTRHLRSRFTDQVGLGPAVTGRVVRFSRAAELLVPVAADGSPHVPSAGRIADVAAACGYADQAHMAREFRALAGCSPSVYVAEWVAASDPFKPADVGSAMVDA